MNDNELSRLADLIWSKLNSINNQNLDRIKQIELIKPILDKLAYDSRKLGGRSILNYLSDEITMLKEANIESNL